MLHPCFLQWTAMPLFKSRWGERLRAGVSILADRYVTSNMIHQTVKLPRPEWDGFLDWVDDLNTAAWHAPARPYPVSGHAGGRGDETDGLPRPGRHGQAGYPRKERRLSARLLRSGKLCLRQVRWTRIRCAENSLPWPMANIHAEILRRVNDLYAGISSDRDNRQD